MNYLSIISHQQQCKLWWRAFRMWQRRPHQVAPLKDEEYVCASCGTSFQGNFCPRCGQSAKVGRFSFKKAFLLFLDVWGLGNRGMFRSIRDLMFRPGYMIRDYVSGMQSAYFPPFKMFFLLAALSLVLEHGFSFSEEENGANESGFKIELNDEEMSQNEQAGDRKTITINGHEMEKPMYMAGVKFAKLLNMLRRKNPAVFSLLTLMLFSFPLFFFFRKAPSIPDFHYPEFFVALVYTSNAYSIYSITGTLLDSGILKTIAAWMVIVALSQFSGFSKRRVLGYSVLSAVLSIFFIALVAVTVIFILYVSIPK